MNTATASSTLPRPPSRSAYYKARHDLALELERDGIIPIATSNNPTLGPLTKELIEKSATCMQMLVTINDVSCDAMAGVPNKGDSFAEALARFMGKPLVMMKKYEHNGKRHIASLKGKVSATVKNVALIDDFVVGADSKVEAVRILQSAKIAVNDVIVLVDYEQGGYDQLMEWGCHLHAVFTISELRDFTSTPME
ncbi:MAG: hypothetical protein Q7R59_01750 [bacterium]|nr:hypothetical protein [bacterium]